MESRTPIPARSLDELIALIGTRLLGPRRLAAIFGGPGSGKSTLAQTLFNLLNERSPGRCAVVPMDGFHLDDSVLQERGLMARKGAPETFDVEGFIALHERLARNEDQNIAVPVFDRSMELSRAGALIIPQRTTTVLVEGNYLLLQQDQWQGLACHYDLTIKIATPIETLKQRLMQRWLDLGLSAEASAAKVYGNDLINARLVEDASKVSDVVYLQDETV